jgi:hypothetical protein
VAFPRVGQIWQALRDCEIGYLRPLPHAGLFPSRTKIAAGQNVRIVHVDGSQPVFVSFLPLDTEGSNQEPTTERCFGTTLQLKTVKTIADFDPKNRQMFFMEAFKLIEHTL